MSSTTYGLWSVGPSSTDPWYNAYPHNGGRNYVLADGHAKWYTQGKVDDLVWYSSPAST